MTPAPITRATAADLPALVALLGELFSIEQDFQPAPDRQRRGLELLLAAPPDRAAVLVARDGSGLVIGLATAQMVISTAEGGLSAWVEDVVVAPDQRGRGLGGALLDALLDWARTQGASRVQLLADRDNAPALDFYRARGWAETRLTAWRMFPPEPGRQ